MPTSDSRSTIRRKLGRGLGSLISAPVRVDVPDAPADNANTGPQQGVHPTDGTHRPTRQATSPRDGLHHLDVSAIAPNPRQPRQHFDDSKINALAESIRVAGVMQPIVVRPAVADTATSGQTQAFELIAGERRWRAAQVAGLKRIPAVVREVDDRTAAEFSLVENVQREDLNPLEKAEAFQELVREFNLSHAEIADRVGLDRSSVSNHVRLLELDDATKSAVRDGRLSMGHARALLALTNIGRRTDMAAQALRQEWSVRELERQIRQASASDSPGGESGGPKVTIAGKERSDLPNPLSAHLADLQKRLGDHLGTKVHVHPGRAKGSGKLVIDFYSIDQFEGLLRRMDFEMQE